MLLKEKKLAPLIASVLILVLPSCSRQEKYSTYADCVLTEIGPSQSQAAVLAIQDACRSKFPPSEAQLAAQRAARRRAFDQAAKDAQAAADAAAAAAATTTVEAQEK